jgi:Flp pilus assembly protein CpaB
MRASTLFALTIAVLIGLGAIAAVRYTGIFTKAAAPVVVEPVYKVVVARQNLFEGMTLSAKDVAIRELTPDEVELYRKNSDKYLPPVAEAAQMRIVTRNVEAGKPLLREYFQDLGIPAALHLRLGENMRAVNVSVFKERAAGGLIQKGEHVDVYLTTNVGLGSKWDQAITLTAPIARNLRVVAKRDTLWTGLAAIPEDRPVHYTLEANPYRAALIEFAKQVGIFTLVPTDTPQARKDVRPAGTEPVVHADPKSQEYRDEDKKVAAFVSGQLTVGAPDLERIFNLKPPVPDIPPILVERYTGVDKQANSVFPEKTATDVSGSSATLPVMDRPRMGYQFRSPDSGRATEAGQGTEPGHNQPNGSRATKIGT